MNYLAVDFGTRRIGLAYSLNGIIFTLPSIANDAQTVKKLVDVSGEYSIGRIYVGLSEGPIAKLTLRFVNHLQAMLKLPIETVEEAVSTIEATEIYKLNNNKKKALDQKIDSVAAAVILRRVINFNEKDD
jgi:putative transcription antitermination factor YqgF